MAGSLGQSVRPVIVLRYHDYFDVVIQRVRLLRQLNPGVEIHGLQGKEGKVPLALISLFDSNTQLDLLPELALRNMDLSLLEWFRNCGKNIKFTHAYVVEWDLLFTAPLHEVMPFPQAGQSMLTGYTPLSLVEWKWAYTNGKKLGPLNEWLELKRYVAVAHDFCGPYWACIGPGAVLAREFFEVYSRLELPLLCHDELRLPLIHCVGKLAVRDNGLYPVSWYSPAVEEWVRRFNVRQWEVEPRAVLAGVRNQHAAYHPVRKLLSRQLIKQVVSRYNAGGSAPLVNGS